MSELSKITLKETMSIGDTIIAGGNDNPTFELGLKIIKVKSPDETLMEIAVIGAYLS